VSAVNPSGLKNRPLPIVLIGAGGIASSAHLPAYRKGGLPVAAIVDRDGERARAMAAEWGVALSGTNLADVLAQLQGPVIFDVAVPAGVTLQVLQETPKGSAVLIQKPMGETLKDAMAIVALCHERGLKAAVNFQLRWAPNMVAARAITDSGALGKLHDIEVQVSTYMPWELWSFLKTAPRLEIVYHSIHYVDLVRAWFGNPHRVLAKTLRNPRTPKLAATKTLIVMDYGEWKRVHIATNHGHDFPDSQMSRIQWEGTEGMVEATMGVLLDYPRGKPDTLRYAGRSERWRELPVAGNWFPDAFVGSMGSLQAYVAGEAADLPTGVESAFDTMRVVEAAYLSSERDGVALPE
jgi:predicted dehydrogenase